MSGVIGRWDALGRGPGLIRINLRINPRVDDNGNRHHYGVRCDAE